VAMTGAVAIASAAYGIGTQAGGGNAAAENGGGNARGVAVECGPGLRFDGLAEELGVSDARLRAALEDFHAEKEGDRRGAFASALADALGKDQSEVEDALEGGPHSFMSLRRLAAALDVTPAELREALREVRSNVEEDIEAKHDELVKFLADRFDLSEDRVREALPGPPADGHFERHRFGPGGPGGPPPFGPGGP